MFFLCLIWNAASLKQHTIRLDFEMIKFMWVVFHFEFILNENDCEGKMNNFEMKISWKLSSTQAVNAGSKLWSIYDVNSFNSSHKLPIISVDVSQNCQL